MNEYKYVLLTVTDGDNVIQYYDWSIDSNGIFRDTESIINNSAISITTYSLDEQEDFFEAKRLLEKSVSTKMIDLLTGIQTERMLYHEGN